MNKNVIKASLFGLLIGMPRAMYPQFDPGDWSATLLGDVKVREEEIWTDPRVKRDYVADVIALQTIISHQTAVLGPVIDAKKRGAAVSVTWLDVSNIATQACTVLCTLTGVQLQTQKADIDLLLCREATPIKISTQEFLNNAEGKADVLARAKLKQAKELDEYLCQQALAKLILAGGTNEAPVTEYEEVVSSAGTNIQNQYWDEMLIPYFELVAKLNHIGNPYFLHGMNFWFQQQAAAAKALNADEKSGLALLSRFDHTWDPVNMTAAGASNLSLMIDAPSVAFASLNFYTPNMVSPVADYYQYSYPSRNLPGVVYDVEVQIRCEVVSGVKHFFEYHTMKCPKFDLIQNQANYLSTNTGVLEFYKVADV